MRPLRKLRRVLRRTDRMLAAPGADSPERIDAAFEWFREQIGRLAAEERRPQRRRADVRDRLP